MSCHLNIAREALLNSVREMAGAVKAASVWFFDTVIAREATEDDLPESAFLVAHRDDIRRTRQ